MADETTEVPTTSSDVDDARSFFEQPVPVAAGAGPGFPPPPPAPAVAPQLPSVAAPSAPRPVNTAAVASQFATVMEQSWAPQPQAPQQQRSKGGGFRRGISWLVVVAVLGGLGWAGYTYGPELIDRADSDETVDEPAAPLAFPVPTTAPTPIRTATFVVESNDATDGIRTEETTIDFESQVSRTLIQRPDGVDLEVLTLFDGAVVRRVDQPIWYRLDRGTFPVGAEHGRVRWVRTLDELVPPSIRAGASVVEASESAVGTQAARRMVVEFDPTSVVVPVGSPNILPPGATLLPRDDAAAPIRMEVWVDPAGVVRKSVLPDELGGETITVTSTSPEAWLPVYPTEDMVKPITATALFELGL